MSVSAALEECRAAAQAEAQARRDPHIAVARLLAFYYSLPTGKRREADLTFRSWLKSREDAVWHLALILVSELSITNSIPELIELANRFRTSEEPGSPQWTETVDRTVDELKMKVLTPPTTSNPGE